MAPKRARGLKKSATEKASKKTKTEDSELPENAQTIVIEKEVEEGDDLGEISALLERAIEKLETDTAQALPLLNGTIHESDQLLRKSTEPLPAIFYYNYGLALFELGRLSEDDEFESFLELAEERLNDSLERVDKDTELENKAKLVLGKVWFSMAAIQITEDQVEVPELAQKAFDTVNKATLNDAKAIIEWADIAQHHGALYSQLETRTQFISWAEKKLERLLDDEPENAQALTGLGLCKLQTAHYWLDKVADEEDEEEDEEEKTELTLEEKKALEAILESKKYLELARQEFTKQDKLMPQILADLGEVYLNEANLVLGQEEQEKIYVKTVEVIKEAQKIIQEKKLKYELPEILTEFAQEQEQE